MHRGGAAEELRLVHRPVVRVVCSQLFQRPFRAVPLLFQPPFFVVPLGDAAVLPAVRQAAAVLDADGREGREPALSGPL